MTDHATTFRKTHQDPLLGRIELSRPCISRQLNKEEKGQKGQYMTPAPIARFMASLFTQQIPDTIYLLDPGAGIGSLTSAVVEEFCTRPHKPQKIAARAFEIEDLLLAHLQASLKECKQFAETHQVQFEYEIIKKDFIEDSTDLLKNLLFRRQDSQVYTHVIMNPPYRKIRSDSEHRRRLSSVGIETSNLYTAFLALAIQLLKSEGELAAITPRSFCNGPYFRSFRKRLLEDMCFHHIHVFDSRDSLFGDEEVLQENIVFHAVKNREHRRVIITSSVGQDLEHRSQRDTEPENIVHPADPDCVIHIPTNELDQYVLDRIRCFENTLTDLGIDVSTGRVVEFRAQDFLCNATDRQASPLIYPNHFEKGTVEWPPENPKKPCALLTCANTQSLFMPKGYYVVVRRFSSKEEFRRIVPALYNPQTIQADQVAFENHLNVFHKNNAGLPEKLAKGLAVFLNSTLLDMYFRHFNGHTQVNAADLKMLPYPSRQVLEKLSQLFNSETPSQETIDSFLEEEVLKMPKITSPDPAKAKRKIEEAMQILKELGFPSGQQNERSGLTLLALVNMTPKNPWSDAKAVRIGITPIMDFCRIHYGRTYAPNTRETFRRQTMHQFVSAGLALENPNQPGRPVNSPRWCYQIEPAALKLIQTFKTKNWKTNLKAYFEKTEALSRRYAKERKMKKIPLTFGKEQKISLTPGKHNELIKQIIQDFAPRYAPGSQVIYIGDTGKKWAYFDERTLRNLGVEIDVHGKMPDVVLYLPEKDWILLVEAVTSHGPVDSKRREELARLFRPVKSKLIYVTAFPSKTVMTRYLSEISWETEVWIADSPTHLIHFNGERFLGPYEQG